MPRTTWLREVMTIWGFLLFLVPMIHASALSGMDLYRYYNNMEALVSPPIECMANHPFPMVFGPGVGDRIVIVGAGPAGLHMAYKLVKLKFQNITIFEESDRVGGQTHTDETADGSVKHDMGACYTNGDYKSLFSMIHDLDIIVHKVPVPEGTARFSQFTSHMDYHKFIFRYLHSLRPNKTNDFLQLELFDTMYRYMMKHRELFGTYNGDLMPKPEKEIMETELNVTFDEFLINNNMKALRPLFLAAHTIQGYGQLNEISAIYGLMWMTPQYIFDIASRSFTLPNKLYMFYEGFQYIWENVAKHLRQQGVRIVLNARVRKIKDMCDDKEGMSLKVKYKIRRHRHSETFNWLIWSPSLKIARKVIKSFKWRYPTFYEASRLLKFQYLATTLVEVHNETWSLLNFWMDNVQGGNRKLSVWADRYSAVVKDVFFNEEDETSAPVIVTYVYGKNKPSGRQVRRLLRRFYKMYKPKFKSQTHIWKYFPHFSVKAMSDGILWKLFSAQGTSNAWFIGSSVSFESVKSVMEYNNLILKNFVSFDEYDHF